MTVGGPKKMLTKAEVSSFRSLPRDFLSWGDKFDQAKAQISPGWFCNLCLVEEGVAEKVVISQSGRHFLHLSESYLKGISD